MEMNKRKERLLLAAGAGMELSWLYAWATLTANLTIDRPFPLIEALGAFVLAVILSLYSRNRGWRIISILGLQIVGFVVASCSFLYILDYFSEPLFSRKWLMEISRIPTDSHQTVVLVLGLAGALVFWAQGVAFALRSTSYNTICSRFDIGITAFFVLMVFNILVFKLPNPQANVLLFPFFIFSLLSLGLARNGDDGKKDFISGYRGVGVVISFLVVVLFLGAGSVSLVLPYLARIAEMGYGILKSTLGPLAPFFMRFFRAAYDHELDLNKLPGMPEDSPLTGMQSQPGEDALHWIFLGSGSLFGLIGAIILGWGIWHLFRWLLSKTPVDERRQGKWNPVQWLLAWLKLVLSFIQKKILWRIRRYRKASGLYAGLLDWGRKSGLPSSPSETPVEYSWRLGQVFPVVEKEIRSIVEVFNEEVYGEITVNPQNLAASRTALRRLRSPALWPTRLKTWFR